MAGATPGFCKTQYASLHGPEHFLKCHRAVIDLLQIWTRLGAKLTIKDEGGYWPDRDEQKLLEEVGSMNRMVAAMGGALKDAEVAVESPVFAHPQFEYLEAEGLMQHHTQIHRAVTVIGEMRKE
ncbi:MAG: hypothetical protein KA257_09795 [Opitutaceae bacterium]|nr:hypothetical protein [Opitutaceae bacterium]MBP9914204.1 hypothetical protein [Opitutaceae bacterium]